MGVFDGMKDAKSSERGTFFPAGFKGTLELVKMLEHRNHETNKHGFIAEFIVQSVSRPGVDDNVETPPVEVGDKRTWYQNMGTYAAKGALKQFGCALAKMDDKKTSPAILEQLEKKLDEALLTPEENMFVGSVLALETHPIRTKAGTPFTRHDFAPVSE